MSITQHRELGFLIWLDQSSGGLILGPVQWGWTTDRNSMGPDFSQYAMDHEPFWGMSYAHWGAYPSATGPGPGDLGWVNAAHAVGILVDYQNHITYGYGYNCGC